MEIWRVERQDGLNRADPSPVRTSKRRNVLKFAKSGRIIARGGYVLSRKDCVGQPQITIATGSEVTELAVAAYENLDCRRGVKARAVSMPSTDAFDKQDAAYRELAVPPKASSARVWRLKRVSLTTGSNTSA